MYDLKLKISEYLNIDIDSFYMQKNAFSAEIRELDSIITDNGMRNRGSVILILGKPKK